MVRKSSGLSVCVLACLVIGVGMDQAWAGGGGALNFVDSTGAMSSLSEPASPNEKEVEFGDYDRDGDLDVVIANGFSDFQVRRNKLYRNDLVETGSLQLVEVTGTSVIPAFSSADIARNAFFRDYNGDGFLDIIIVNDNNTSGDAGRTKIYIQDSADNTFDEEGVTRLGAGTGGAACSAVSADFDGDNDIDLYVGNYPGPSQDTMYFNDGSGFFSEVTGSNVPGDGDYTVDCATGDMNGDGKIDLLIANWTNNFIYYNDNQNAGSGEGDFSYTNSAQAFGGGSNENAMEAGDFDGDNDLDFYWSEGPGGDTIYVNTGNDVSNRAVFTTFTALPASVRSETSRKATVADFDNDGRLDIFVMKQSTRPTLLRNCSVGGTLEFVDWTPAGFPNGSTLAGWHAGAMDVDSDGDTDLVIGTLSNGDFLFLNDPTPPLEEDVQGSTLPEIYNDDPIAINGTVGVSSYTLEALAQGTVPPAAASAASGPSAAGSTTDTYTLPAIPSGANVSVILSSADDYTLEVRNPSGSVAAVSERGGDGVEEVVSFVASQSGDYTINVTANGVPVVPTVSEWGIVIMTLLVLTAGTIVFNRRTVAVA